MPVTKLTAIDSLPSELLELIFRKLEFHQLLVLREVCVRWQYLIDKIIERRPLWLKKVDDNSPYYRFFDVKRIYESKDFNVTHSQLALRQCTAIHSRICRLVTYNPFMLIGLDLDNLIHLEIKNKTPIFRTSGAANLIEFLLNPEEEVEQTINLKFKRLRTLAFKARTHVNFVIDAANLASMEVLCGLHRIQLVDPKTVSQLCICHYSRELLSFKNLTKLTIGLFDSGDKKVNLLKHFDRLKELTIWDMKRTSFNNLIKQKEILDGRTLKFYYKGVSTDLEQFDFAAINKLNSDALNETSYEAYVALAGHLKEEFTQTFLIIQKNLNVQMSYFIKFRNVNSLLVRTHRISLANWKILLKSLKLEDIIIAVELEQKYLACLPRYCKRLARLSVEHCDNLDFILELKHLSNVSIRGFPSFSLLKSMFTSLLELRTLKIMANDTPYVLKISDNLVSLTRRGEVVFSDSKESFLYASLFNTQSWTQLLDVNGNAKCERSD